MIFMHIKYISTVYCPNGANAPRYRGCLSAICYGTEAIKVSGSLRLRIFGVLVENCYRVQKSCPGARPLQHSENAAT